MRRGCRLAYTSNAMALRITSFLSSNRATLRLDAPCGTSTNTPSPKYEPYGFSMEYTTYPASAPPVSNTSNSNLARNFISTGLLRSAVNATQILSKNNRCGHGVYRNLVKVFLLLGCAVDLFRFAAEFFLEHPLGFPARQTLVRHFHRNPDLLSHALRESFGLFGHFAARAIQP